MTSAIGPQNSPPITTQVQAPDLLSGWHLINNQDTSWAKLSSDVILLILRHLNINDIIAFGLTCKHDHVVSQNNHLDAS